MNALRFFTTNACRFLLFLLCLAIESIRVHFMEERIVIRIEKQSLPKISDRLQLKRVAAYARVSTASEEQLNSVEAQKSYYKDYIQKNKDWIYAGLYTDDGISGLSYLKREGFNRMIADAHAGKIDIIVTKSISRFARNTVDTLSWIQRLRNLPNPV